MTIKIINGTGHEITFFAIEDTYPSADGRKLFLKKEAKPIAVIEKGVNLNAVKGNAAAPKLETNIPLKGAVIFISYDPIPDDEIVIVSNLYRSAVKELGGDTSRLATVDGTVYENPEAIRPCGCLGLAVG